MRFLINLRLLFLGLWLGAAVFFIGAAQAAFAVLPSRELAGAVVGRDLLIVNIAGIVIGLLSLAFSFIKNGASALWSWTERLLLVLLTVACAGGQFVINLWMDSLKAQIGKPIDEAAADDPLRIQFDQLHQYSTWIFLAAIAAALIAFFLIGREREKKAVISGNNVIDATNQFKF